MSIWESLSAEELRNRRREKSGRITFDCFNLKVRGNRVHCACGYLLGRAKDGTADLNTVMRGILFGTCKVCKDYDGGE